MSTIADRCRAILRLSDTPWLAAEVGTNRIGHPTRPWRRMERQEAFGYVRAWHQAHCYHVNEGFVYEMVDHIMKNPWGNEAWIGKAIHPSLLPRTCAGRYCQWHPKESE